MLIGPKAFGEPHRSAEEIDEAKTYFNETILKQLDEMLASKTFFCSAQDFTVVDIVFYNEILTVLVLTHYKLRK